MATLDPFDSLDQSNHDPTDKTTPKPELKKRTLRSGLPSNLITALSIVRYVGIVNKFTIQP